MKLKKIKPYLFIVICYLVSCLFLFLFTFNYLDLAIIAVSNLIIFIIFAITWREISEIETYEKMSQLFCETYLAAYLRKKDPKYAYEKSKSYLEQMGFTYTYEEIAADVKLLNILKNDYVMEMIKYSLENKVTNTNINRFIINTHIIKNKSGKAQMEKCIYYITFELAIFPLIRLFFGNELLNFNSIYFHITTLIAFALPYLISLIYLIKFKLKLKTNNISNLKKEG